MKISGRWFVLSQIIGWALVIFAPLGLYFAVRDESSRNVLMFWCLLLGFGIILSPIGALVLPGTLRAHLDTFPNERRKEEVAAEAARLGLVSRVHDQPSVDALTAAPLQARDVRWVFAGRLDGDEVRVFDCTYQESSDQYAVWSTCAFAGSDRMTARATIVRVSAMGWLGRIVQRHRFTTGNTDFDLAFDVKFPEGAERTLDPKVIPLLVGDRAVHFIRIERGVLYCRDQVPLSARGPVLDLAVRLRHAIA